MKGFISGIALTLLVSVAGWDRVASVLDSLDAAAKRSVGAWLAQDASRRAKAHTGEGQP